LKPVFIKYEIGITMTDMITSTLAVITSDNKLRGEILKLKRNGEPIAWDDDYAIKLITYCAGRCVRYSPSMVKVLEMFCYVLGKLLLTSQIDDLVDADWLVERARNAVISNQKLKKHLDVQHLD
jgi:hypothetical protein